ncbi:Nonribosomal peptide synthetase fmpE [Lachnellula suecica]|uniref:Nonribosomal peptide synthetase fmpE n=1 Tax=Lachnellula suecica TaxID=602035 RepID=A0A8T9C9T2_9HELO|nr:Nonribosomal peptide synthetase fmpE [Lachnellula suecica]
MGLSRLFRHSVAFVVIGKWPDSELSTSEPSMHLVVSHWANTSVSLTQGTEPQLTFGSFDSSKHGSKVNTAVNFADIHHSNSEFSYVLHSLNKGAGDIHLYTQPPSVPAKFPSALWSTLLEVNTNVKSTGSRELRRSSTSKADLRAIRSFMPARLFAERLSLHQLFQKSVQAVPNTTAVQAWDGALTYAELDKLSDKVAKVLSQKGVRTGQYVPFSFEKSMWMVVAILGILKSGGAIVPIDPSQPEARALEIVRETHADIVVVSASQVSSFKKFVDTVLPISSDTVHSLHEGVGASSALPQVQPPDPAIIIFTS